MIRFGLLPAFGVFLLFLSCNDTQDRSGRELAIVREIKSDPSGPFYVDFRHYPANRSALPVGVFDSGTGGLAVLEAILCYDGHDNVTHAAGADGIPDFAAERFQYLADDANMPYGRYDAEGKADFLRELVVKDVAFLVGNRYYLSPWDTQPHRDKEPVKAIVIACNTATAFGLETVRKAMDSWGAGVEIMGIIEAGAAEALHKMQGEKDGVIGILATEGTCASGGYPRTIQKLLPQYPSAAGGVAVIQQAGIGLAGAIDGDKNYIDPLATAVRKRTEYRGPDIGDNRYPIDPSLLTLYHFDTTGNHLLTQKDGRGEWREIQLNSVRNYIRYMVTEMAVRMEKEYPGRVLREVILGCTHYPYYAKEIKDHFLRLRQQDAGYARVISLEIELIDPAASLAGRLYDYLQEKSLWGTSGNEESRFFISVANPLLPANRLDSLGRFVYDYKYGRNPGTSLQYVKIVAFSQQWIPAPVRERLRENVPCTWKLIRWQ